MARKTEPRKETRLGLESQDDAAYLSGKHSPEDEAKQIKTPAPRRSTKAARQRRGRDEEGG